jgi:hypothetical protein
MASSIRKFWLRLENSVHPDDEACFRENHHTFNLDFPPPAFVGHVDDAPVVFLEAKSAPADCAIARLRDCATATLAT